MQLGIMWDSIVLFLNCGLDDLIYITVVFNFKFPTLILDLNSSIDSLSINFPIDSRPEFPHFFSIWIPWLILFYFPINSRFKFINMLL